MRKKKKAARCSSIKATYELTSQPKYTPDWFARQGKKVAIKCYCREILSFKIVEALFALHPQWRTI